MAKTKKVNDASKKQASPVKQKAEPKKAVQTAPAEKEIKKEEVKKAEVKEVVAASVPAAVIEEVKSEIKVEAKKKILFVAS
jgi:hypothetical protein